MKLQKIINSKVRDKQYYKWIVVIPPTIVKTLGWNDEPELETSITVEKSGNLSLVMREKNKEESENKKKW